jgi:hypothetical protein
LDFDGAKLASSYHRNKITKLVDEIEATDSFSPEHLETLNSLSKWPEHVDLVCEFMSEVYKVKAASSAMAEQDSQYVEALLDFMLASLRSFEDEAK